MAVGDRCRRFSPWRFGPGRRERGGRFESAGVGGCRPRRGQPPRKEHQLVRGPVTRCGVLDGRDPDPDERPLQFLRRDTTVGVGDAPAGNLRDRTEPRTVDPIAVYER